MYESPINVIQRKLTSDYENHIYKQVCYQAEVTVDKVELIKALQYDRNQYDKGYDDGQKDMAQEIYDLCCGHGTTYIKKYLNKKYGVGVSAKEAGE